jgi:hypothetical protein
VVALTLNLTEDEEAQLAEAAARLGVSAEKLVTVLVRRHLEVTAPGRTSPTDDELAYALRESVRENEELYRRLAQ